MERFVYMSHYAGMREDLVQAAGGNSAFKAAPDRMVVKASGVQLADVTKDTGYAVVDPRIIRRAFSGSESPEDMTEKKAKQILAEAFIEGERPSIETFLHAVSGRYSLHTHPAVVNALACRKDGDVVLKKLFPDALIVPYAAPGIALAGAYFEAHKEYKKRHALEPKKIFLLNHGFMASADTAEDVIGITEDAVKKIEQYLKADYRAYHEINRINGLFQGGVTWLASDKHVVDAAAEFSGIWEHGFSPDCVVFLGKKIYAAAGDEIDRSAFEAFSRKNGYPAVIYYKQNVYIHADSVKKALEIQSVLSFSAQVMIMNKGMACNFLSGEEKDFLLDWEAEKYRKNKK